MRRKSSLKVVFVKRKFGERVEERVRESWRESWGELERV